MKYCCLLIIFLFALSCPPISSGQSTKNPINEPYANLDIPEQVDSLSAACWRIREIDSDSSLTLGLRALSLAEQHNLNSRIGKLNNYIGVIYLLYLYQYTESIPYFHKAMENSLLTKDSVQLAYAYNNLCDIYLVNGNIPLAQQYAELSLKVFKKVKNKSGQAYAYMNLGEICREKKEFEKSLYYFQQADDVRKKINSSTRTGFSMYNQAKTYEESGDLESAMSYFQQSMNRTYGKLNFRYIAWSLNGIADVYYAQGKYEQAIEYYNKALNWNINRNHDYGKIDNYIGMAMVYAHQNKRQEGEDLLDKALSLASKIKINTQLLKAYNSYIDFYRILGDYENVTRCFDTFLLRYDSVLTVQQFEIANVLERNFSVQQDLIKTEQQLKTNKLLRTRLLAIILLMILVMLVLIWLYRSHKKNNRKLEEINRTKDKLFSVISHDLRSPFNSLIGFSEMLITELEDKNYVQAKEFAGYIHKSSLEGFDLLTNLLNWSLSQRGRINFAPELVDFNKFFDDLKDFFHTQTEKYKVGLLFENSISNEVAVDPNIIRIILVNLITNAFKYTKENGTIRISASQKNTSIKIRVEDTGTGMAEETVNKLFDKKNFIKSKKGLRDEKGTGLGISIINELIQIHKGKISVKSKEGIGTTFELELFTNTNL